MKTYRFPGWQGEAGCTKDGLRPVVSTVRLDEGPGHDYLHIWNRSGKAGVLTVQKGDGEMIVALLLPNREEVK